MNRPDYDAELARGLETLERWGGEFPTEVADIPQWRAALPVGETAAIPGERSVVVDDLTPDDPGGPPVIVARFRHPDR